MKIKEMINLLMKRNKIILYLIIIVLINIAGLTLYFKFDLTKNNSFSISPISKEVVSNLADPLTIKVIFSKNLPAPYNSVERYLVDLMEEYSEAGKYFNYEIIDPDKDKDSKKASEYGISPTQVREIASDQVKFRNAYMGIAIVHGDLIEKINNISDTEGIEYRITTTIKRMTGKMDALQKLEHPIKVTLYSSSSLPINGIQNLDKKVGDIVKKCNEENYNKLEFSYIDSDKEKSALSTAEGYGIIKLQWPALRTAEGKIVAPGEGLLGILVQLDDRFGVIQILSRSIFGQYAVGNLDKLGDSINKAVDNVINVNPKIGYITGHDERDLSDNNNGASTLSSILLDMYELISIDLTKEDIPGDINIIIINGPKKEYSEYELFKIDQFIMRGKSVIFLMDSFQEINTQQMNFGGGRSIVLPLNTGMEKLLSQYGVTVNKDIVLDKKCYKTNQQGFAGQDIYFIPLIQSEGLNKDNAITRYFKTMVWMKGSSVSVNQEKLKSFAIKEIPLVSSSEESWLMKGRIDFMPFGMSPPLNKSEMGKRSLAELLEGQFESYYKGREIPENPNEKKTANNSGIKSTEIIWKAVKEAKIIVAGTSEITLSNIIDKEGKSPNAVFLHNALDYLSGNNSIQEMRSKGLELNPLKDTGDNFRFILKLFNIAGLPIFVICAGIITWKKRNLRKKKISEEFAG